MQLLGSLLMNRKISSREIITSNIGGLLKNRKISDFGGLQLYRKNCVCDASTVLFLGEGHINDVPQTVYAVPVLADLLGPVEVRQGCPVRRSPTNMARMRVWLTFRIKT